MYTLTVVTEHPHHCPRRVQNLVTENPKRKVKDKKKGKSARYAFDHKMVDRPSGRAS